jgi:hypothetical protein
VVLGVVVGVVVVVLGTDVVVDDVGEAGFPARGVGGGDDWGVGG